MSEANLVEFRIFRFDPDEEGDGHWQEYRVPCPDDFVVLDALNYIKDEIDPTLSHRWSCRMGVCGSCGMEVNGTPDLGCKTFVRDLEQPVRVGPLANFPVIRDLVIDFDGFLEKLGRVKPWIIRENEKDPIHGEYLQSPDELERFKQFTLCINCGLCYAACPSLVHQPDFIGPAALALGFRYNLDSRDQGEAERYAVIAGEDGVWACTYANECSEVCPKHVDPAAAVNQAKLISALQWTRLLEPRGRKAR